MADACDRRERDDQLVHDMARRCLASRVRLLNRAVCAIYDAALRPHRIKASQLNLLVAVGHLDGASAAELVDALHLEKSTVSRNVDRLASRGWVRRADAENARASIVRLTPAGRRLLRRAHPSWVEAQAEVESLVGARGRAALVRMASDLR